MVCYYHTDKPTVGQCKQCGKGLCKPCFDQAEGTCNECKSANMQQSEANMKMYEQILERKQKSRLAGVVIVGNFGFVSIALILSSVFIGETVDIQEVMEPLLAAYIFTAIFVGWLLIDRWQSSSNRVVIRVSVLGFLFKLFGAYMLGIAVWPFVTVIDTIRLIVLKLKKRKE